MNRDPEGNVWPAAHRRAGPPRCRSDCLSDLLLGVKTDCSSTQRPLCFNTDAIGGAAQPTPHTVTLTTQSRQVGSWKNWTNNSLCWKSLLPVCVRDRWLNKTEDVSAVPVALKGLFTGSVSEQNRTWRLKKQKQKTKQKQKLHQLWLTLQATVYKTHSLSVTANMAAGRDTRDTYLSLHLRHLRPRLLSFLISFTGSWNLDYLTSIFPLIVFFFFLWLQWKLQTFCTRSRSRYILHFFLTLNVKMSTILPCVAVINTMTLNISLLLYILTINLQYVRLCVGSPTSPCVISCSRPKKKKKKNHDVPFTVWIANNCHCVGGCSNLVCSGSGAEN